MKPYQVKQLISKKDSEGSSYTEFEDLTVVEAKVWPASGKIQAELYGTRLTNILNMVVLNDNELIEGSGVCVSLDANSQPDYKIISIKRYTSHMVCELEKII